MTLSMPSLILLCLFASSAAADLALPEMQDVRVGDLSLTAGSITATLPNQPVAGGVLSIENIGSTDDRLVAVVAEFSEIVQIHSMTWLDGSVIMKDLTDGLVIPSGEVVVLDPNGTHLMFMRLDGPMVAGELQSVRFLFENAGAVDVLLPVHPFVRDQSSTQHLEDQ